MRRQRTETPLQALVMLNGPQFVEPRARVSSGKMTRAASWRSTAGLRRLPSVGSASRRPTARERVRELSLRVLWSIASVSGDVRRAARR